jgi:Bax protein
MDSFHQANSVTKEMQDTNLVFVLFLTAVLIIILALSRAAELESESNYSSSNLQLKPQLHKEFIAQLSIKIAKTNRKIKYQQALLDKVLQRINGQSFHRSSELNKLRKLYHEYGLADGSLELESDSSIQQLRARIETIPASLVIAMAALESNWGNAKQAAINQNYFLITCSQNRCGDKSKADVQSTSNNQRKITQKFTDYEGAITALMKTINSQPDFTVFRNTRAGFKRRGQLYSASQLGQSFKYAKLYSEQQFSHLQQLIALLED